MKNLMIATTVAVALAGGTIAYAQTSSEPTTETAVEQTMEAKISLEQAVEIARAEVPGTVVEVELEDHDGDAIYNVYIAAEDGTLTEIEVDAASGEVLVVEVEDGDEECDDDHERGGKKGHKNHDEDDDDEDDDDEDDDDDDDDDDYDDDDSDN